MFVSSAVHANSVRTISMKTGISESVCQRVLRVFRREGWVWQENGMTIFKSFGDVDNKSVCTYKRIYKVSVGREVSVGQLIKKLRVFLVKSASDSFQYIKKKSSDYLLPKNGKQYAKAQRSVRSGAIYSLISAEKNFAMSNRVIGGVMGKSKSTGSRLMKWAQGAGIISKRPRIKVVDESDIDFSFTFMSNGKLWRRKSDEIFFNCIVF